jgi:Thoeris protein ThsB, TIR-like domain
VIRLGCVPTESLQFADSATHGWAMILGQGAILEHEILTAINRSEAVVVLLRTDGYNSTYVQQEIARLARQQARHPAGRP